jgi:dTDP-4-dehydrorhamnose 3,5-epimerase
MIFRETSLPGAFIMELEKAEDERGFFAPSWSSKELAEHGLEAPLVESAISFNNKRGTLRGMHYQEPPHGQTKIVRCTMGLIYDVIIDLRAGSPTFRRWVGTELTARNRLMLYVPASFAHGFQTLGNQTEVFYQMSAPYNPESDCGFRWDDPAFGIDWPLAPSVISEKDRSHPFVDSSPK